MEPGPRPGTELLKINREGIKPTIWAAASSHPEPRCQQVKGQRENMTRSTTLLAFYIRFDILKSVLDSGIYIGLYIYGWYLYESLGYISQYYFT